MRLATLMLAALFLCGCSGPNAQIARCQTEKQELLAVIEQEKIRTQAVEERALALESRLDQSEKQLASLVRPGSRFGDDETRTASSKPARPLDPPRSTEPVREPKSPDQSTSPRSTLREMKLQAPAGGSTPSGSRLADLAERDPRVQYDPALGTARLAIDVPFSEGSAELSAAGRKKLDEAAAWLRSPQTADLRVLVAGVSSGMTKPPAGAEGARFANDRQLAAARALAVADYLDSHGIKDDRLAVAGSGGKGGGASAARPGAVEILLSEPETPVAGIWPADVKRR
ncbi:MAG TPA: OmpA family protein [Pirellulaceae bacterium]|nr:OmpA family protein [Pirellulaceae bacterium]